MFQAYKVKWTRTMTPPSGPVWSYRYKNCTIAVSKEMGVKIVSICAHGYPVPVYPAPDEVEGILSYFGIDPSAPYEHSVVPHFGDPTLGDSNYYMQKVS